MTCSKQPAANVTLGTHLPCDMCPNHSATISLSLEILEYFQGQVTCTDNSSLQKEI